MKLSVFRTLSIDQLRAQAANTPLKRTLGPISLTSIGIGGIIGSAIYGLLGTSIIGDEPSRAAGPAIVWSFCILALVGLACGLCYAEFAALIPKGGSAYTYAYATLGELFAWIIGWDLLLEYAISNSVVAIIWARHIYPMVQDVFHIPAWAAVDYWTAEKCRSCLGPCSSIAREAWNNHYTIPVLGIPLFFNVLAGTIVLIVTGLLVIGVEEAAAATTVMVIIKLSALLFFVVAGYDVINPENRTPFLPAGFAGVWAGASTMFFGYIGFDAVSTAAEEAKNPRRDMLIGIIGSLLVCTVIYALVAWVLTGMVPMREINKDAPLVDAVRNRIGPNYADALAAGAGITMAATLLVFQYGQIRILYSMSCDGLLPLPSLFQKVHPRYRTPHLLTIAIGFVVAIMSGVADLNWIAHMTILGALMACALVCAGAIVLIYRKQGSMRFIKTPVVPAAGIVGCMFLMVSLNDAPWIRFGIWLTVGLVFYFFLNFYRKVGSVRATQTEGALAGSSGDE